MHKVAIVEKEANEMLYWLELSAELGAIVEAELKELMDERRQLLAIFRATG